MWNETVTLLRLTGANSYRFSISWPRLVPDGSASSKINQKAIDHYNTLINALLANNITPVVTLYHWDLPQSLQDAYGGFLNTERFTQDFLYFAETAFSLFGDRVKYWLTFNEPSSYCLNGYVTGSHAPGRCINPLTCTFGFVPLDLVRCVHTTLIAHARAVDMYRKKFQSTQKGKISLAINGNWAEPFDSTSEQDKKAAQLQLDFSIGWYADPIFLGRFPQSLTSVIGWMMPTITKQDWTLLKGSADFFGLNQYTTNYVTSTSTKLAQQDKVNVQILPFFFQSTCAKNGTLIGEQGESEWLFNVPFGFKALLKYIDEKYNRPDIIITENGWSVKGEENMTMDQIIHDVTRIDYYQGYLDNMVQAIKEGVRIKGYISWTLLDNWEWATGNFLIFIHAQLLVGYTNRFGVTHVDRTTQKRTLKDSAFFLRDYFYNISSCVTRD